MKISRELKSKILIVDDDPDIVSAISAILIMSGYAVTTAENGAQCLSSVRSDNPDLILLDLMLPDMPGTQVAKNLQEISSTIRNIPIIVMSAAHDAQQIVNGMKVKCLIEKPFDIANLLSTISRYL